MTVCIHGSAVGHLEALFATDWYCETDDLVLEPASAQAPELDEPSPGGLVCQVLRSGFVLIDEEVAVVGSSTMDIRSFVRDHEVNLLVAGQDFVGRLNEIVAGCRGNSHELDLEVRLGRPWHQKHLDNTARLTAALQQSGTSATACVQTVEGRVWRARRRRAHPTPRVS
ncbi:hypothetical protein [Kocuria nitroreducens]|uniref:hypothetical protein n=1 Tax=Kocuria nitroreducens TaxID=3058914 RepID=UPI0036D7BEC4